MTQTACLRGFAASVAPTARSLSATPAEREARRLLSLHTPEDTARAGQVLLDARGSGTSAEWYYLMGICALQRGHIADAQAHLDRARTLCPSETEYAAAYESIQLAARRHVGDGEDGEPTEGRSRGGICDSGVCLDCGEVFCCDNTCDGCGDGCNCDGCCDGGCDCGDCCN